ncbi:MAG: MlaE family lipid ABC transporter permease subunit [Gammaproteobacteria bacterium]|jgi:phospholipid/cholesterol/gamma-HCH transport system permease protein
MPGQLSLEFPSADSLQVVLAGRWLLADGTPPATDIGQQLQARSDVRRLSFDAAGVTDWDTALLTFLARVYRLAGARGIDIDAAGLPEGARRLMALATAVPAQADTGRDTGEPSLLERVGRKTQAMWRAAPAMLHFLGEVTLSLTRLARGTAQFRRSDFLLMIQDTGPNALPIVALISFLVGLIVAYMGAVQLAQFGAQIYIANLVSLGMTREMGALMTGVIMAGRTGAAFAAQLGTMQVNEEIDAFRTLGFNPIDFLVLPRMLALVLVMPLLVLYSGIIGITAGMFVSVTAFDISTFEYYQQTVRSMEWRHIWVGVIKGTVYGLLIAFAGCLRGMQCGRSAQAVGEATTSAVVTGILFIVIAAALLTILFQQLGI